MLRKIYTSPFRVYFLLCLLILIGVISGLNLPVSLFPNSKKPDIYVWCNYGNLTTHEFYLRYGKKIERNLKTIETSEVTQKEVIGRYFKEGVQYQISFEWGDDPEVALKEVRSVTNSLSATFPKEIRDSLNSYYESYKNGFIGVMFYSEQRSYEDLYYYIDSLLGHKISSIKEAMGRIEYSGKQIELKLKAHKMAKLGLYPKDIENDIKKSLESFQGGDFKYGDKILTIQIPRDVDSLEKIKNLHIKIPNGSYVTLQELANVSISDSLNSWNSTYNGQTGVFLYVPSKPGENLYKISQKVHSILNEIEPKLTTDVKYKVIIDPSDIIKNAVNNVFKEVLLAAALAVFILFLFIGSFKNIIMAAIEIPISIILAFILMKINRMDINIVSLGGLALASGMNVDASVVVIENIFRHFENKKGLLTFSEKVDIVIKAVKEVLAPIIVSTMASLIVFIPLAFTSKITNVLLGDLAKTVIFSHGFSCIVALILVPTIRLQILKRNTKLATETSSPIEKLLRVVEKSYLFLLSNLLRIKKLKSVLLLAVLVSSIALPTYLIPKISKEIIGKVDFNFIRIILNPKISQTKETMLLKRDLLEKNLKDLLSNDFDFNFSTVNEWGINIKTAIKDRKRIKNVIEKVEKFLENDAEYYAHVTSWNPAEIPLPDFADLQISIQGSDRKIRNETSNQVRQILRKYYNNIWSNINLEKQDILFISPKKNLWRRLENNNPSISSYNFSDLTRVMTQGKFIDDVTLNERTYPIFIKYDLDIKHNEEIESFPVRIGHKLLPFRALMNITFFKDYNDIFTRDGYEMGLLYSYLGQDKSDEKEKQEKVKQEVKKYLSELKVKDKPQVVFENPQEERDDALRQLSQAIIISIALIALIIFLQFGSLAHTFIILTAIPFGIIGVTLALYLFGSTLSLNSALGVILLNGVSVANSIILVDFMLKLIKEEGLTPLEAALKSAKLRLRPILITSLTSILGMLPVALGLGDGGKVLQPLGISVSCGLWVSMLFTLFLVPTMEVFWLERKKS